MKKSIILALLVGGIVTGLIDTLGLSQADAASPIFSEYPIAGSPLNIEVESPGHIWFSMPSQNLIGNLIVTSTVDYQVITYTVPTLASEPYDLKLASGKIWFTERLGNKIGRFDPSTAGFDEFVIPTLGSQPTGIDILSTSPIQIWVTERTGNKLARLVVTGTLDYAFTEYLLPASYPNAQPEDLNAQITDAVWFSAPNVSYIGYLQPALYPDSSAFEMFYSGGRPWSLTVDSSRYPWITERSGNRIGRLILGTFTFMFWNNLPLANSDPYDLVMSDRFVWFTESGGNRVGQFDKVTREFREFGLEVGSAPKGIVGDSQGCLWIAEGGRNKIGNWCSQYFYHYYYLPIVMRGL